MADIYYIENFQEMKLPVIGQNNANFLYVFTGIAVFEFKGTGAQWLREKFSFRIPHAFLNDDNIIKTSATGALNSISNSGPAVDAGWAFDNINVYEEYEEFTPYKYLDVYMDLAVSDMDGYVNRASFQVFVLVEEGVLE